MTKAGLGIDNIDVVNGDTDDILKPNLMGLPISLCIRFNVADLGCCSKPF